MDCSLDFHLMADSVFYADNDIQDDDEKSKKPNLSLSIDQSDWNVMDTINIGREQSLKFTDPNALLDTPEILRQCVDWQLHEQQTTNAAVATYLLENNDQNSQIMAIKHELQDYEVAPIVANTVEQSYYADVDAASSRAGDGSVSPTFSEAPSSLPADDEGDEEYRPYSGTRGRRGRGRPSVSSNSTTKSSTNHKRKLSDHDKSSDEYKEKRKRNNIAVRKSRDKAKIHHIEVEDKNRKLEDENNDLKKKNESLVREVGVLRKLLTDIGRNVPTELAFKIEDMYD